METDTSSAKAWLTSTQIGAVGEAAVASGLILASEGRLAPFRPFADDDGLDLLVYDKLTRRSLPLQVKCRTGLDNELAGTVQFDVRLKTFASTSDGLVLFAILTRGQVGTAWLVPAAELETTARTSGDKLVVVASAKAGSKDRFSPYRHDGLEDVAEALTARFEAFIPHSPV
jgi:hypothetical protein